VDVDVGVMVVDSSVEWLMSAILVVGSLVIQGILYPWGFGNGRIRM
jgi:hypothetical protein